MLRDGKIAFISDIHMGSKEALKPEAPWHPWCWLGKDRAKFLGSFLSGLADDPALHSVVVLGDLFDDWVAPTHMTPVEGDRAPDALLRKISEAPQNQAIKAGFQRLADAGKSLHYVRGNHDMFLTDDLLREWVPAFTCEPDTAGPGTGAYVVDGLLRAEHGCAYCLANAPYKEDGEYRYPVGYYLARIDAYNRAVNDKSADYLKIFADMCQSHPNKNTCVGEAILSEAADAKLPSGSPFIMNSDYPNDYTVASVADRFRDWLAEWDRRGYPVGEVLAVLGDVTGAAGKHASPVAGTREDQDRRVRPYPPRRAVGLSPQPEPGPGPALRRDLRQHRGLGGQGEHHLCGARRFPGRQPRRVRCLRVRKGRSPIVMGDRFVRIDG